MKKQSTGTKKFKVTPISKNGISAPYTVIEVSSSEKNAKEKAENIMAKSSRLGSFPERWIFEAEKI